MRLSLWLILILAFSVGMCCAFAVRFLYFEATPAVVQAFEPTTKILVATRMIPSGVEITADFVSFQEFPISEVPPGVFTCFAQVYLRQSAFPIPVGCPICEDLLLPRAAIAHQAAFVPTGSQIVALDITRVRQGNRVFLPLEPLSMVLSDEQRIDIRVVPPEGQGHLAEKRNELLRAFSSPGSMRNSGELILENVPIHRIQRQFAASQAGSTRDALELMLEKSDAARLTAAARRGQIRVFVRQDEMPPSQPSDIFEIAESPVQAVSDLPPLIQSLSLDIPRAPNVEHSPSAAEVDSAVPVEHVQRIAPVPAPVLAPVPAPADLFDPVLLPAPAAILPLVSVEESLQYVEQPLDRLAVFAPKELPVEENNAIRNEGMIAFGASFRNVPSTFDIAVEQNPTPTEVSPLMDEPGQEALSRPPSELTASPRISSTIQFLPPGRITPTREPSQEEPSPERVQQVETVIMSPVMPLVMPSAMSAPATQERMPRYSPFERRIYTVLPSEELQAPQRLTRSSDAGTQMQ